MPYIVWTTHGNSLKLPPSSPPGPAFKVLHAPNALEDPRLDKHHRSTSGGLHEDISPHRTPRKVHHPRVGVGEGLLVSVRSNPHHQVLTDDTATNFSPQHEREAAEHLLLDKIRPGTQRDSNAVCECEVVRHAPTILRDATRSRAHLTVVQRSR